MVESVLLLTSAVSCMLSPPHAFIHVCFHLHMSSMFLLYILALVCLLSCTFLLPAFAMFCRQRIPACAVTHLRFFVYTFALPASTSTGIRIALTHICLRNVFRTYAELTVH